MTSALIAVLIIYHSHAGLKSSTRDGCPLPDFVNNTKFIKIFQTLVSLCSCAS